MTLAKVAAYLYSALYSIACVRFTTLAVMESGDSNLCRSIDLCSVATLQSRPFAITIVRLVSGCRYVAAKLRTSEVFFDVVPLLQVEEA
jgi:hypothetical protein